MSSFDSPEEFYMSWWLDELFEAGYIDNWCLHPEPYILAPAFSYLYDKHLKTKTKTLGSNLLSPHIYTPDYHIDWNEKARGIFFNKMLDRVNLKNIPFVSQYLPYSVVEVKAGFSKFHAGREFSINQKWMMQRHGIYVQKVIISNKKGLFADTFTPEKFLLTSTGKPRKLHYTPRTLKEFTKASQLYA